ncbi:phage tail assembly chaperone G, partial [Jeotgalibacillus aurantiacus]
MEITLQVIDEQNEVEEKHFSVPFVPASTMLAYFEIEEKIENKKQLKPSEIKLYVDLIVKTFRNQFTAEEFFDGVPSHQLMGVITEFILSINKDPYADKKGEPSGE